MPRSGTGCELKNSRKGIRAMNSNFNGDRKTALITGGNGGLGYQCAKTILGDGGWNVLIAGRPGDKTNQAIESLQREAPTGCKVSSLPVDLASLESVRGLAAGIPALDAIVCNAATQSFRELKLSRDGFEITFAVNHLAHFLLVQLLLPKMRDAGRIVMVSSGTHDPDTLDGRFNKPLYRTAQALALPEKHGVSKLNGIRRYSTSKLCNILFAYELARRLQTEKRRIRVNAYDPGATPGTGLTRDYPLALRLLFSRPMLSLLQVRNYTVEVSGSAMARLVLDPALENTSGSYFHVHNPLRSSRDSYDKSMALDLWNTSLALTGLEAHEYEAAS